MNQMAERKMNVIKSNYVTQGLLQSTEDMLADNLIFNNNEGSTNGN